MNEEPSARGLSDLSRVQGTSVTFHAGLSGQTHHWKLRSPDGSVLAQTARVHRGGPIRQALWKLWNMANMHVGDDIHVELRGVDDIVLARVSSHNDSPAVVKICDESGTQIARSVRTKATFAVFGRDDAPITELSCDGDGPWRITDSDGNSSGELLAGEPDPSRKPGLVEWALFTDLALNTTAHQKGQHLGLRRVVRYSYAPLLPGPVPPAFTFLPLLASLTY